MTTYTLPDSLLQPIVAYLNAQPAGQTRQLLNALEAEVNRQDQDRAAATAQAQREKLAAEIRAELAAAPAEEPAQ